MISSEILVCSHWWTWGFLSGYHPCLGFHDVDTCGVDSGLLYVLWNKLSHSILVRLSSCLMEVFSNLFLFTCNSLPINTFIHVDSRSFHKLITRCHMEAPKITRVPSESDYQRLCPISFPSIVKGVSSEYGNGKGGYFGGSGALGSPLS